MVKKIVIPVLVAGALFGGALSAGTASATTPTTTATTATPATSATAAPAADGHLAARAWLRAHRRRLRREGAAISAKAIGVTTKALVTELRTGKSVAEVAAEHGVSAQTVVNALVERGRRPGRPGCGQAHVDPGTGRRHQGEAARPGHEGRRPRVQEASSGPARQGRLATSSRRGGRVVPYDDAGAI